MQHYHVASYPDTEKKKEAAAATSNKPNSAQNPSAARGLHGHQTSEAVSNALAGDGFMAPSQLAVAPRNSYLSCAGNATHQWCHPSPYS